MGWVCGGGGEGRGGWVTLSPCCLLKEPVALSLMLAIQSDLSETVGKRSRRNRDCTQVGRERETVSKGAIGYTEIRLLTPSVLEI